MKTTMTAVTSFVHGNRKYEPGDPVELNKGEIDELRAAGFLGDVAPEASTAPDVDDMLGGEGEKMEGEPLNKMDAEPDNKASHKKTATKAK